MIYNLKDLCRAIKKKFWADFHLKRCQVPFAAGECLMYPFHPRSEERTITQGPLVQYSGCLGAEVGACWFFFFSCGIRSCSAASIHPTEPPWKCTACVLFFFFFLSLLHLLICILSWFPWLRSHVGRDGHTDTHGSSSSPSAPPGPASSSSSRLGALSCGEKKKWALRN